MNTHSRHAFTLIELVIVSAIVALLASVAAPRFAGAVATRRLDAAEARMIADFDLAKRNAYLISANQQITFNVGTDVYTLDDMAPLDREKAEYSVALAADPYGVDLHAVNFGADTHVTYTPYGTPSSGGTVTLKHGTTTRYLTIGTARGKAEKATQSEFNQYELLLGGVD